VVVVGGGGGDVVVVVGATGVVVVVVGAGGSVDDGVDTEVGVTSRALALVADARAALRRDGAGGWPKEPN
jgi:hypothetical protein